MAAARTVACIGECMIEMTLPDAQGAGARVGFAGDTFNAAVYLKRAAQDLRVRYVTALGTDAASDRMIETFAAEGLDVALIERRADRLPGCYAIVLDGGGERRFLYWRDASAARTLFDPQVTVTFDALDGCDLVYLSGITVAILAPAVRERLVNWLAGFRARGGQVAFDSNYRPALWPDRATSQRAIAALWSVCDVGLPSLDDEMALFGDTDADAVLARLRASGVATGALKRGAAGPLAIGDAPAQAFPPAAKVVDTTAAGDSFNGAYLAALLRGEPQAACLRAGHGMACRVIGHPGAILPKSMF
ncbi:sugar kinase [Meridianimarinicoccus sp. RP-17]|uniref:sugar kinase n=1 Tax=Meridianimarinicoccus zhengii TaxID=2056810 RepID=UPI000DAC34A2|nr:sugar kinase [Phycocomes zhengii]